MNDIQINGLKATINDLGMSKYSVRDPLLAACIGWARDYPDYAFMEGFSERKGLGYQILVGLVSNAFNISRLPSYEDRIVKGYKFPDARKYVPMIEKFKDSLNDSKCEFMQNELLAIYNHTQKNT